MKDKHFRNLIENAYPVQKQAMYEDLKRELNLPDDDAVFAPAECVSVALVESSGAAIQKPASRWRTFFKKPARLATCISMALAVACLAIILPFTLNRGGVQPETPPIISEDRYVEAVACKEIKLDYSLKEYSERNDLQLLYVNWYDVAEVVTSLNVNKEDQTDIVFYHEIMMHKYTGSIVELYITDMHTSVDVIRNYHNLYRGEYFSKPSNVKVVWGYDTVENGEHYTYVASFTYDSYHYTLVLRYPMDENDIFELVDLVVPVVKRLYQ